jgi:DNA-binding XRE family transcriptional regulator
MHDLHDVLKSAHPAELHRCVDMSTEKNRPYRVYTGSSIGAAIRHYRKEAGLTQQQLADRAGIDRTYLSRLERGHETEQVRHIIELLRQLGVRATLQYADW